MLYYIRQNINPVGVTHSVLDHFQTECFKVSRKFFIFGYKGEVLDLRGYSLLQIEKEILHLLPHYNIMKYNVIVGKLKKEFTFFNKKFTIESNYGKFTIEGNILALDFKIVKDNNEVGTISKTFFSLADFYELEVIDEIPPEFAIALVIIIDNILHNYRGRNPAAVNLLSNN